MGEGRDTARSRPVAALLAALVAFAAVLLVPAVAGAQEYVPPVSTTLPGAAPSAAPPAAPPAPATDGVLPEVAGTQETAPTTVPAEVEGRTQTNERTGGNENGNGSDVTEDDLSTMSTGIPQNIDWSVSFVVTNIGLGALLMLLLLAASQLFNDAMRVHHDRIVNNFATQAAWLTALSGWFNRIPKLHPIVTFGVSAAVLGLLADPSISFSISTLGQILGMGLALLLIVVVFDGTASFFILKGSGVRRSFRIFPIAIAVAMGCLVASRFFGISPGVLYGLFVGAVWAGTIEAKVEGKAYAIGGVLLVSAAMVAWGLHRWLQPTADVPSASLLAITFDTAAAVLFVGGIQTVIVNLLPMPFLWGESVIKWSRIGWAAILIGTLAIYLQFVVRPNPDSVTWGNLWFVLVLVAGALAFWGYFAVRRWLDGRGPKDPESSDTLAAS